ncbi:MAG: type II secretion system protein GspE [Fusobacteriia bacterium 4572_132]|nr:MAG: type II secretion system protein GspE [Fusobacteriia bacterium 4572_132]
MEKKRLGDCLIEADKMTEDELKIALKEQKESGGKLGEIVIKMGFCSQRDVIEVLGEQMGIPFVKLDQTIIDEELLELIPKKIAKQYKVMPIFKFENTITIAMVDPLDIFAIDELEFQTGFEVSPSIALEKDIEETIEKYYGNYTKTLEDYKYKKKNTEEIEESKQSSKINLEEETTSPAIDLVNTILKQAINEKVSDIHIEEEENETRVRFRIDGILHKVMNPPKKLESSIISRLKVMANLDIAEKRIPQDGRIELKYNKKEIDIRISTLPTIFGEKIVMRLLDKSNVMNSLEELGYSDLILKQFREVIRKPYGIFLVTGPTGSGKTSTLYGANQVQINPNIDLTFATGLRSILRQDPDIVMVGEIRDKETAEIAIEAAMTGHLVFSTLHTNTASGAITRLIDMGIEPFLLASSLVGIIGQRLVRKICNNCKEKIEIDNNDLKKIGFELMENEEIYHGKGCKQCKNTGYTGRTTIYELLIPNEELKTKIKNGASSAEIEKIAKKNGMRNMREIGIEKVIKGITTLEEIERVTQETI